MNNNNHWEATVLLEVLIQLSSGKFYLDAHPDRYGKCNKGENIRNDHQNPSTHTKASIGVIWKKRAEIFRVLKQRVLAKESTYAGIFTLNSP